jgi:hypothetical protein
MTLSFPELSGRERKVRVETFSLPAVGSRLSPEVLPTSWRRPVQRCRAKLDGIALAFRRTPQNAQRHIGFLNLELAMIR